MEFVEFPSAVDVPVDDLIPADSPRLTGQNERHVRMLAASKRPLPPIMAQRRTGRVIDGMHRLAAARLSGHKTVPVRYQDCDEMGAFILSVQENITHGLPLTLEDRKAAARRILAAHPQWSDRRLAAIVGLAENGVTAIRTQPGPGRRTGPTQPAEPAATVARPGNRAPEPPLRESKPRESEPRPRESDRARRDPLTCLRALARDPAFRSTESGKTLLRALTTLQPVVQDPAGLIDTVPEHVLAVFRELALENARTWQELADCAARRGIHAGQSHSPADGD